MTSSRSRGIAPRPDEGGVGRYAPSDVGSSRALLAPGLRTLARPGWRGSVATAVAVVLSDPWLWLLGALGFALRGGIFLLALLIIVVPTPVEVRQLLGENLSSSGLTPAFLGLILSIAGVASIAAAGALLLAAGVELAAFRRFVRDPEIRPDAGMAERAAGARRGGLLARLFVVQVMAAALLALAVAVAPYGAPSSRAAARKLRLSADA